MKDDGYFDKQHSKYLKYNYYALMQKLTYSNEILNKNYKLVEFKAGTLPDNL